MRIFGSSRIAKVTGTCFEHSQYAGNSGFQVAYAVECARRFESMAEHPERNAELRPRWRASQAYDRSIESSWLGSVVLSANVTTRIQRFP